MKRVAILCVKAGSHYLGLDGLECYDRERDAWHFQGGMPVVAHPPCAQWGALRKLATVKPAERDLGPFCVDRVQRCGGVLEHPAGSTLFDFCQLPSPGANDEYGFTMEVEMRWWGFPARKLTWLYVVGVDPAGVECPLSLRPATHVIDTSRRDKRRLPFLPKSRRDETPAAMCRWLVDIARRSCFLQEAAA